MHTLQNALATSMHLSSLFLMASANPVASYASVILTSSVLRIPHLRGMSIYVRVSGDGELFKSHSVGMRAYCSSFFREDMSCHFSGGADMVVRVSHSK